MRADELRRTHARVPRRSNVHTHSPIYTRICIAGENLLIARTPSVAVNAQALVVVPDSLTGAKNAWVGGARDFLLASHALITHGTIAGKAPDGVSAHASVQTWRLLKGEQGVKNVSDTKLQELHYSQKSLPILR